MKNYNVNVYVKNENGGSSFPLPLTKEQFDLFIENLPFEVKISKSEINEKVFYNVEILDATTYNNFFNALNNIL